MEQNHAKGSVRHAEKRRTSTCDFADRVARVSIQAFRASVPQEWREENKQTCIAAIVAHFAPVEQAQKSNNETAETCGHLQVVGLGVGTKFLSEDILREDEASQISNVECDESIDDIGEDDSKTGMNSRGNFVYGKRLRDCHAEVLARRAFRRQITLEMIQLVEGRFSKRNNSEQTDIKGEDGKNTNICTGNTIYRPILMKSETSDESFSLRQGVTLHFYSSSAPCGNATLKKFATMSRERYKSDYGPDQWPSPVHEPIHAHSIRLGQFTLLVKKGRTVATNLSDLRKPETGPKRLAQENGRSSKKRKTWPANESDEWCPPGTSIVALGKGSIHTCSDKLCRWNCFGMQGSLLASVMDDLLYMSTLTVGRKFTSCICQRAVCCRVGKQDDGDLKSFRMDGVQKGKVRLNHPAIMGTGVYLDETGVLDMSGSKVIGQDVRFISNHCWVWWPYLLSEDGNDYSAECIDGETGLSPRELLRTGVKGDKPAYSRVSTFALTSLYLKLIDCIGISSERHEENPFSSLSELKLLKLKLSQQHEEAKNYFFKNDKTFWQWRRRGIVSGVMK